MCSAQSLEKLGVSGFVHQAAQFARVGELDTKKPAPSQRILVDETRRRLDFGIDGDDLAGSRREHVARRLDALDHGGRIAPLQRLADRRRLGKDDVAELLLGVLADADDAFAALDADVLVVLRVADLRHHASPWLNRDNTRGDEKAAWRYVRSRACRAP